MPVGIVEIGPSPFNEVENIGAQFGAQLCQKFMPLALNLAKVNTQRLPDRAETKSRSGGALPLAIALLVGVAVAVI